MLSSYCHHVMMHMGPPLSKYDLVHTKLRVYHFIYNWYGISKWWIKWYSAYLWILLLRSIYCACKILSRLKIAIEAFESRSRSLSTTSSRRTFPKISCCICRVLRSWPVTGCWHRTVPLQIQFGNPQTPAYQKRIGWALQLIHNMCKMDWQFVSFHS